MSLKDDLEQYRSANEINSKGLVSVFKKYDSEQIEKLVTKSLKSRDASFITKITLQAVLDTSFLSLRFRILKELFNSLFKNEVKQSNVIDIVSQILLHLDQEPKLTSTHLSNLISICMIEFRDNQSHLEVQWLPMLAKLLSLCFDQDIMTEVVDEREVSGKEFRLGKIRSLCYAKWESGHVASILDMIKDITQLTNEELDLILEKIGTELKNMQPEEVPPMVYQALLLTHGHGNFVGSLIFYLSSYFNQQIVEEDSEDLIGSTEEVTKNKITESSLRRAESIVMVHINSKASGHPIVTEIMKMLKVGLHVPDLIFNPFTLQLCLSLTSLKQFRSTIVDGLKAVILKTGVNIKRKKESIWFSIEIGQIHQPVDVFCQVVRNTYKYGSWGLIGDGVIDLAFMLLDVNAGLPGAKVDEKLKSLWNIGEKILKEVVSQKLDASEEIIKQLGKRIMFSKAAYKYTDTLKSIIIEAKGELMYKTGVFDEILDHVVNLNYSGGKRVLLSLMPIIRISPPFRDSTILIIRKGLFSPKIETRRIAINGILALLKTFKISSAMLSTGSSFTQRILSQSSAGLSQVSAELHTGTKVSYEALCLELLGVLKRGFTQQVGVRMSLYQGLYDVVVKNPELCPKVLQLLHQHATKHRLYNTDAICCIDVHDIAIEQDNEAIVVDPIGWFVQCVQLIVGKGEQIYSVEEQEDDPDLDALPKLTKMLETLSETFKDKDLNDMNLEKQGVGEYNRTTVRGQANSFRVDCMKNVYEALMEYVLTHGADKDVSKAQRVLGLYTRWKELNDLVKKGAGNAGGGKKKKAAAADDTIQKAKAIEPTFVIPEHVYSLKALSLVMNMILMDKKPAHQVALNVLKDSDSFIHYILRVVQEKLKQIDKSLTINGQSGMEGLDMILSHMKNIAQILIKYAIFPNPEQENSLLLSCIEILLLILQMVAYHYEPKKVEFMKLLIVTAEEDSEEKEEKNNLHSLIYATEKKITEIHDLIVNTNDSQNDEEEADLKKTLGKYFHLLDHLANELTNENLKELKVYDWIKIYCEKSAKSHPEIFKPAVDLLFKLCIRVKPTTNMFKEIGTKIRSEIGQLNESLESQESDSAMGFINETTGESILSLMAPYVETLMDVSEMTIQRCKKLCGDSVPPSMRRELRKIEPSLVNNFSRLKNVLVELTQTKYKSFGIVIKLLIRLYAGFDQLGKYFMVRHKTGKDSVSTSRFETLAPLIASDLTCHVYKLVNHVNDVNTEKVANTKGAKNKTDDQKGLLAKAKVEQETRNIPNLIFKVETFEKTLLKLSTKYKNKALLKNAKMSTARDFRLQFPKEGDENQENENNREVEENGDKSDENDSNSDDNAADEEMSNAGHAAESTRIDSVLGSQDSNVSQSQESQPPPPKKMKVKMSFNKA